MCVCGGSCVLQMVTYIQVVGQLTGENGALRVQYPKQFQRTTSKFGPFVDAGKLYLSFLSPTPNSS